MEKQSKLKIKCVPRIVYVVAVAVLVGICMMISLDVDRALNCLQQRSYEQTMTEFVSGEQIVKLKTTLGVCVNAGYYDQTNQTLGLHANTAQPFQRYKKQAGFRVESPTGEVFNVKYVAQDFFKLGAAIDFMESTAQAATYVISAVGISAVALLLMFCADWCRCICCKSSAQYESMGMK